MLRDRRILGGRNKAVQEKKKREGLSLVEENIQAQSERIGKDLQWAEPNGDELQLCDR